jgi:retron-type reverse transcriptase
MKRIGYLFEKIVDIHNLELAYENAKRHKTHYKQVQEFEKENIKEKLLELQQLLIQQKYKTSQYKTFKIKERGKERIIYSLPFYPDRIVHHAIVQVLSPIWIKSFIRDTYASIPRRGIHDAVKRIQKVKFEWKNHYVLKCDIEKFYPSVNHQVLKTLISRKVKDTKVLNLLNEIIDSEEGIPIGNYLSQYFGNLILSPLDHWIKSQGIKYYYRYCDDFVIVHKSKKFLHILKNQIKLFLKNLKLKLKSNHQIFPINQRPLDFVGYVFHFTHTLVRKVNIKRFKKRIKIKKYNLISILIIHTHLNSFKGWLKYADTSNLNNQIIRPIRNNVRIYLCRLWKQLSRNSNTSLWLSDSSQYSTEL